jgi:hypothetical protein
LRVEGRGVVERRNGWWMQPRERAAAACLHKHMQHTLLVYARMQSTLPLIPTLLAYARMQCTHHKTQRHGTQRPMPNAKYRIPNTEYRIPNAEYQIPKTEYQVPASNALAAWGAFEEPGEAARIKALKTVRDHFRGGAGAEGEERAFKARMNSMRARRGLAADAKMAVVTGGNKAVRASLERRGYVVDTDAEVDAFHVKWALAHAHLDFEDKLANQVGWGWGLGVGGWGLGVGGWGLGVGGSGVEDIAGKEASDPKP